MVDTRLLIWPSFPDR